MKDCERPKIRQHAQCKFANNIHDLKNGEPKFGNSKKIRKN